MSLSTAYLENLAKDAAIAKLQQQNAELYAALDAMWREATGQPKSCGHNFACVCAGDLARAALAHRK